MAGYSSLLEIIRFLLINLMKKARLVPDMLLNLQLLETTAANISAPPASYSKFSGFVKLTKFGLGGPGGILGGDHLFNRSGAY